MKDVTQAIPLATAVTQKIGEQGFSQVGSLEPSLTGIHPEKETKFESYTQEKKFDQSKNF